MEERELLDAGTARASLHPSELHLAGGSEGEAVLAAVFDLLIFSAYFTIPAQLYLYLQGVQQTKAVMKIRLHFILFIVFCGLSHLFSAMSSVRLTSGTALLLLGKCVTAVISIKTAYLLYLHAGEVLWLFSRTVELESYVLELERMNEELGEMRKRAEASAQTSKQILNSVSHELRTPIHAIKGTLDVLQHAVKGREHQSLLAHAQQSTTSLDDTVSKILTFTSLAQRSYSLNRRPAQVAWIAEQAMDLTKLLITRYDLEGVVPCIDLSPSAPVSILTDEYLLVVALRSLVENAIKYTERGHVVLRTFSRGRVVSFRQREDTGLRLRPPPRPGSMMDSPRTRDRNQLELADISHRVELRSLLPPREGEQEVGEGGNGEELGGGQPGSPRAGHAPSDTEIVFQVVDTGVGIPDELKFKVFEDLKRGNDSNTAQHRGLGLGLAICSRATDLLGGMLHVRDNDLLGPGTIFELSLPVESRMRMAGGGDPGSASSTSSALTGDEYMKILPALPPHVQAQRIIIASDDPIFHKCMESLLRFFGCVDIGSCNRTDASLSANMDGSLAFLGPDVVTDSTWSAIWADWEAEMAGRRRIIVAPAGHSAHGNPKSGGGLELRLEMPVPPSALSEVLQVGRPTWLLPHMMSYRSVVTPAALAVTCCPVLWTKCPR